MKEELRLVNDEKRESLCSTIDGCKESNIHIKNNFIFNILCNNSTSCAGADGTILEFDEVEIICNGNNNCSETEITIESSNSTAYNAITIICGASTSCNSMVLNIIGNISPNITCIDYESCDGSSINNIDSDYDKPNYLLNMHSFSKDIILYFIQMDMNMKTCSV